MKRSHGVLAAAAVLALAGIARGADEFEARMYKDAAGKTLPYRILTPKDYDAKQKYPLVFFMHGAGERGTDNGRQLVHGTKLYLTPENRTAFPCFVVAPQCPNNQQWVDTPWSLDKHTQPEKPSEPMRLALELIGSLQKEFSIDAKRLYVTGLSMGGFGTWDAIQRNPGMFAAAIPVCGGADDTKAGAVAKTPVWCFHGDKDGVVKTIRSRNIIAAIKAAGGEAKYTEYPGVGHDAWNKAYAEPELLKWLFAQKLP